MKTDFYDVLSLFCPIVILIIVVLNVVPNKISCDSASACAYDNAYLKCATGLSDLVFGSPQTCEEGTYGYLTITFCVVVFMFMMIGWMWGSGKNKLPRDYNARFFILMFSLLLAAFGIGAASMRYVLLTEFYESKQ